MDCATIRSKRLVYLSLPIDFATNMETAASPVTLTTVRHMSKGLSIANIMNLLLDEIRLNITQSKDNSTQLRIDKKAKGRNQKRARENANAISYPFEYYNKNLLLDSQWQTSVAQARNEQQILLNLEVAEGQYLYIDRDFSSLMYRGIKNDQDYSRRKIAGHLWKMENGTLICKDCTSISGNIDIDKDRLRIIVSDDEADFELSIDQDGFQIKTSNN